MKKQITYLLALFILLSCSKDSDEINLEPGTEKEQKSNYLNFSSSQINSSYSENEFTIKISSNTDWEIISKPEWVEISPEKGSQDGEIIVNVSENTNSSSRNGEVQIKTISKNYDLKISQQSFPLSLISYSGSETTIKMDESKYLLFNKPVTLNWIASGEDLYSFHAGPVDIEYYNDNHGIKFTAGPSNLGSTHKYKFSVSDQDNHSLEQTVDFNFFSQKIIVPGSIYKMILDDDNYLWVLTLGPTSHIFKFRESNGGFEEELRFEVDIDNSNSDYNDGDFFINPYNELIYIPDYVGEEVDVYSKTGTLVKHIKIPLVNSDHPQNPHSSPVYIGFNIEGKGIISLQGKGISGIKWRFIDSSNNDVLTEPNDDYPYYFGGFQTFVLNNDRTKLYVLEDRSPVIKIFDGTANFEEINMKSLYPNGADAAGIVQNRINNKIYVNGLYNQQIINPDLSYLSLQSYNQSLLGNFCYDPNLPNHIYALNDSNNVHLELLDYNNQKTVLSYSVDNRFNWTNGRGIITTPDDKFIITYSNRVDNTTSRSQIVIYNTEMFK